MGDRQVSVKIRAAFDAAFNATFMAANDRIKGMTDSLRVMKAAATDIEGLRKSREAISGLISSSAEQREALGKVQEQRKAVAAQQAEFDRRQAAAAREWRKALAEHRERRKAYLDEKEALEEIEEPTREQIKSLRQLRRSADEARDAQKEKRREMDAASKAARDHWKAMAEAGTSVEALTRKEKELTSGLKVSEDQLKKSEEAAERYGTALRRAGIDTGRLDEAGQNLNRNIERQGRLLTSTQRAEQYSARADELRADARGHVYTAIGAGFAFMKPLRDAIVFEKAMTRVKAMAGANAEEYRGLRDDARRLGAETVYSALEVAKAQNELATAGFRANQIIATMPHMLALANSSMTSLARTAEITAAVMQGFNLDVSEMKRIGDAMTAAYTSSASSLESIGEMMKYVASVASVTGASLEEVLGAGAVLHNSGITGSMAGTALRAFFLRLSDPPRETEKMLKEMNVSVKDSAGNMRSWLDILHDINRALLGTGTARQAEAWKKLAGEEAAPGVAKIAAAEKSGALWLEIKKYKLAPAYNEFGQSLLKMSDETLKNLGQTLGIKFGRSLSGGGMLMSLAGSLQGLNERAFDSRMDQIIREVGFAPQLSDIKAEQYQASGTEAEAALKKLHINPLKALGGVKPAEEMTREIKGRIQTLPLEEQLRYVDIFFSRTRSNMRELLKEFAKSGSDMAELNQALGETQNMEKTRKELSENAANDLEQIKGDFGDMSVSLGESLIPLLKEITTWLKPITEGLAKWIKENQGWARTIMLVVGGLFAFSAAMAAAKFAMSGFMNVAAGYEAVFGKGRLGRQVIGGVWAGLKRAGSGLRKGGWAWKGMSRGAGLVSGVFERLISLGPRLVSSLGMVTNFLRAAGLALVATPIGATITAIAVGGYLIYRNWSTIGPLLERLMERIRQAFARLAPWLKVLLPFSLGQNVFREEESSEPGFLAKIFSAAKVGASEAKDWMAGIFDSPMKELKVNVPELPNISRVGGGVVTQRNVITVSVNIHVDPGPSAPRQVAQKIRSEIQTAFRMTPSFDLFDAPEPA